jgi:prophage maintenance system killer protein
MEIAFLTLEDVLAMHDELIQRYGGTPGLRDAGLLESALAMPRIFLLKAESVKYNSGDLNGNLHRG